MRTSIAALAVSLCLLTTGLNAQVSNLIAGYESGPVTLPEEIGGSICADAVNPNAFYVSAGGFGARSIYRVVFTGQTTYSATLVSRGSRNLAGTASGPNVLDNGFGDIWMASLPDGNLVVTDSGAGQTGAGGPPPGECIFLLHDANSDGDFLDISPVGPTSEVAVLVASPILTSAGNFGGAGVTRMADGTLRVVTSDGSGNGEVIRISADGTTQNLFYSPFDFGSGLAVDSTGALYAGNTDGTFVGGSITKLVDLDADNDALGVAGESTVLTGVGDPAVYDLAITSVADGERLVASTNGAAGPAIQTFSGGSFHALADIADFATGIAIDRTGGSFAPGSGPGGQHLLVSNFSFTTFEGVCFYIVPTTTSNVADWSSFE